MFVISLHYTIYISFLFWYKWSMANPQDTFCTSLGCMDGRVQKLIGDYGREQFGAEFPDTITEPGLDGMVAKMSDESPELANLAFKISISTDKHHSKGIIVHGHEDCAGNPVSDEEHMKDISTAVEKVKGVLTNPDLPILGVYVKLSPVPHIVKVV
jgi:hypothetical protein